MPKSAKKKPSASSSKHQPLGRVIQDAEDSSKYARPSRRATKAGSDSDGEDEQDFMSEKESAKVFNLAREQQEEEEGEANEDDVPFFSEDVVGAGKGGKGKSAKKRYEDDSDSEYGSEDDGSVESVEVTEDEVR